MNYSLLLLYFIYYYYFEEIFHAKMEERFGRGLCGDEEMAEGREMKNRKLLTIHA